MHINKEKIIAAAVTAVLHIALALLLLFVVVRTIVPEELGGIEVQMGNLDESSGEFRPQSHVTPPATSPPVTSAATPVEPSPEPPALTQETEESLELPEEKPTEKITKEEQQRLREQELADQQRKAEEARRIAEERRRQEVASTVAGAFGKSRGEQSQGATQQGAGSQGSPDGKSEKGAASGVGGFGSFDLAGRGIAGKGLPKPVYSGGEEGTIVIQIIVNPNGKVIGATIALRGTNIQDPTMRRNAIDAARRAHFTAISETNNQQGTITYRYRLTQ